MKLTNLNPFKSKTNDFNYGAGLLCPLYCLRYGGNSLGFLLLWLLFVLAPAILLFPNLRFSLAYTIEILPTIFVGILAGIYAPLSVKERLTERKSSIPQTFYEEQRIWNRIGAIIAILLFVILVITLIEEIALSVFHSHFILYRAAIELIGGIL